MKTVTFFVILLCLSLILDSCRFAQAKPVKRIVTGPIDATKGLTGYLEIGMTRQQVLKGLGSPLSTGLLAAKQAIPDPNKTDDYFDGVFAYTGFNFHNRLISIDFRLNEFHQNYQGEQTIILLAHKNLFILSRETTMSSLVALIKKRHALKQIRIDGPLLMFVGTGTSLFFDSNHRFTRIYILAPVKIPSTQTPR